MKTCLVLLVAALAAVLVLTGSSTALAAESGGVFRLPFYEPGTLDPA